MKFAVDHAADSVFQIDSKGRITYCNEAACRNLGYSEAELLSMRITDIDMRRREADLQEIGKNTRNGESPVVESVLARKDGTIFPVEVTTGYFTYAGEEHCFAFIRDITKRKRAEEERAHLDARVRQQQKIESISSLASGVAHEINNPINIVMNYAELIAKRCKGDEQIAVFAREIVEESQRIATIVRNLLAFAREDREIQQPTKIAEVVDRTLSLMREVLRKHDIDLAVSVPDDLPAVPCRFQQLQQVLMNLITNSRDALTDPGVPEGRRRRIAVTARALGSPERVRITVEDNGIGIPAPIIDRIFDPFFTTKPRDRGTGLGLSVSHGIITEHGGALSVESHEGEHTSFHIDLPSVEESI
jgi:PAS domain S-box-containing protein